MLNYEYPPLGGGGSNACSWKADKFIDNLSCRMEVKHHPMKFCKIKYGLLRLGKGFLDLIVITLWQKYSVRPIHVFGGLGLVLGLSGSLLDWYLGMKRLFFNRGLSDSPLPILSISMVIIGAQFAMSGVSQILCSGYIMGRMEGIKKVGD